MDGEVSKYSKKTSYYQDARSLLDRQDPDPQHISDQIKNLKSHLKYDIQKSEDYENRLQQTQHQKEIYRHESQMVLEKMKDSNWAFTKDVSLALAKTKKPNKELEDIAEKFMTVLEQREKSWKMFQASLKNYNSLKALMNNFSHEKVREGLVDNLIQLWKNKMYLQPKIEKFPKGAMIILDWITSCVEYKIKKSTLDNIEKQYNELDQKLKDVKSRINEKNKLISELNSKYKDIQDSQVCKTLKTEQDEQFIYSPTQTLPKQQQSNKSNNILDDLPQPLSFNISKLRDSERINESLLQQKKINQLEKESSKPNDDTTLNISAEVKPGQEVNPILRSDYYFPESLGSPKSSLGSTRQTGFNFTKTQPTSSTKKKVSNIYNVIANNEPRNEENVIMYSNKLYFLTENYKKKIKSAEQTQNFLNIINENQRMFTTQCSKKKLHSGTGSNSNISSRINTIKTDDGGQTQVTPTHTKHDEPGKSKLMLLIEEDPSRQSTPDLFNFTFNQ